MVASAGLMEMLTLVIPTHERHEYLSRVLEYYKDIQFNLIIVDSSKHAYREPISNPKFKYIHCPELGWSEKLLMAADEAHTKYITMCADDDFVAKTAFEQCISFLEKNSDYQQVQGYMLGFRNSESKIDLELIYPHAYKFDVSEDNPISRLKTFYENYVQTFYVVRRKKEFKEILLAIKNWNINGKMIDQMISTYSLIKGKMKVLPIFFGIREFIANSSNQTWLSLEDLYHKKEHQSLINRFFLATADCLSEEIKVSATQSEVALRKIYEDWILTRARKTKTRSQIFNNVVLRLFYKITRFLRSFKDKSIYKAYGIVTQKKTKELILIDESQNSELEIMKRLIRKHAIKSF